MRKEKIMKKKKEKGILMQELLDGYDENLKEIPAEENYFSIGDFEHGEEFPEHEDENDEHAENSEERGKELEKLRRELIKAEKDSEVLEKLAEIRGISKEEMRDEILWAIGKAAEEKMVFEIMAENPGMNRETARELARFRLEVKKAEKNIPEKSAGEAMLLELEKFLSAHSGEGIKSLDNEIVSEWEGGIPLETAFEKFRLSAENARLLLELEELQKEKEAQALKNYAREHSPGSARSAAGIPGFDEFVEGLFKEY